MLKISTQAATVLTEARATAELPNDYGLRLSAASSAEGPRLGIAFVPEPAAGDQVSEQEGIKVFVAPDVAEPLADAVIDVQPGEGGPELILRPQAGDASS